MLLEPATDFRTEKEWGNPLFGVLAHGYQPPRIFNVELLLENRSYRAGFSIIPEVNDRITTQVYEPILGEVQQLSPGLITSVYAPLRAYLKRNKPDLFVKIQEVIRNTPDREYCVLGDPLVHVILPLLPPEDQRMLLEAGRQAFINDFNFSPKGLWLPETAVSKEVLHNAAAAGYEFVPLYDNQIVNIPSNTNLDAKHNVCMVQTGNHEEIAVVLGNSRLSEFVSYTPWSTFDANAFMKGRQQAEQQNGRNALMTMDLERFGHHQIGAEQFLKRILNIQKEYGFSPLNMRQVLDMFKQGREKTYVDVKDKSSWSCQHNLGRWTGECNCGEPSKLILQTKQKFYKNLKALNIFVNALLDTKLPGWREDFAHLFVAFADDIFTGVNFGPQLFEAIKNVGGDEKKAKLYLSKIEIMIGLTSCGWFFGEDSRDERNIPSTMIQGVKELFPDYFQ